MAKLMPGWVRQEGITFYQDGQVSLSEEREGFYRLMVAGFEVAYDEADRLTHCPCDFFASKGYCAHVAGVEHFLKHYQPEQAVVQKAVELPKEPVEHVLARKFLDGLDQPSEGVGRYCLSVRGEPSPYTHQLIWTMKIQRLPDERSYIIRDIPSFLELIDRGGFYQIGKNYYEQLSWDGFDGASQELLVFLNKLASSDSQTFYPNYGRHLYLPLGFFEEGFYLFQALGNFSLTILPGLEMAVPAIRPLTTEDGLFRFQVKMALNQIELVVEEEPHQSLYDGHYLYWRGKLYALDKNQYRLHQALKTLPIELGWKRRLTFGMAEQGRLAEYLLDFAQLGRVEAPKSFQIMDFEPSFALDYDGERLALQLTLTYPDGEVKSQTDFDQLPFTSNRRKKERIDQTLTQLGFQPTFETSRSLPVGADLFEFLGNGLARLRRLGQVFLSPAVENLWQVERPSIRLEQAGGLLEVNFDFSGLDPADIEQAVMSLRQQEPYFISRSGQVVVFDDEVKRISQTLLDLRAQSLGEGQFQLASWTSLQVKDALSTYDRASFSAELEQMTAHLASPETFELGELPVKAQLRDYQKQGVQWLSVLDHYGFGGILADDMGLGKTLQTIAFLSPQLAEGKKVLIVTPSSLIYNWQEEFAKFLPQAQVVVAQGNKPQRDELIASYPAVTLTSYHSFRQDLETYQARHYDYLILDEAQALKNSQTKIAQALRDVDVARCFALSGTPIENRLQEIWSLFQIVLPGLFANRTQFNQLTARQVAKIIQPFVLRRKKEDVLPELPEVTEIAYHNEMSQEQKVIYLAQLERMRERVTGTSQAEFARNKLEILSGITRLRQICNTPQLFMPYEGDSGKLDSLRQLLLQIKENGRRALIFSQFKGMLEVVEAMITDLGLETYILTGSTPPQLRQDMTTAFNKGSRDAFLMSLKAGGVGLNLTGADTVILIDLWWNPAVEMQAIGRAHRLGQEKAVQVYRLITKGSIEEKILLLQENKRHLIKDVLEGDTLRSSLTLEELKDILGINSSASLGD